MTAIDFPTISVGGRELTVRFSIGAQILMRRRGIDPRRLVQATAPFELDDQGKPKQDASGAPIRNENAVQNILIAFSAAVAENFIDQSNPDRVDLNSAPSADYWAMQLHPLQFPEVERAIGESMGKVMEAKRTQLRVVPPPNPEEAKAS